MTAPRREDLPDGSVRIHLPAPIIDGTEPRASLTIRPPTLGEMIRLGDPLRLITDDAAVMPYIDRETLAAYLRLLIDGIDTDVLLMRGDLATGLMIEEIILGFFRAARQALRPSPAPSSDLASPSPTSTG